MKTFAIGASLLPLAFLFGLGGYQSSYEAKDACRAWSAKGSKYLTKYVDASTGEFRYTKHDRRSCHTDELVSKVLGYEVNFKPNYVASDRERAKWRVVKRFSF